MRYSGAAPELVVQIKRVGPGAPAANFLHARRIKQRLQFKPRNRTGFLSWPAVLQQSVPVQKLGKKRGARMCPKTNCGCARLFDGGGE